MNVSAATADTDSLLGARVKRGYMTILTAAVAVPLVKINLWAHAL